MNSPLRPSFRLIPVLNMLFGAFPPVVAKASTDKGDSSGSNRTMGDDRMLDVIRLRFFEFLTGGEQLDATDPDVRVKIREMDAVARSHREVMVNSEDRTAIWNDLPIGRSTHDMTLTFQRLAVMSAVYRTKGSEWYGSPSMRDDILDALDWLNSHVYHEGVKTWGNWWDWQIGTPIELTKCLTLMYDELPRHLVDRYTAALKSQLPVKTAVGSGDANEIWILFLRLLTETFAKNRDAVAQIMRLVENDWFGYSADREGFHPDGSYVMHYHYPYTGSYGASLLETLAKMAYIIDGTPFAVSENNLRLAAKWIRESFVPVMYKGAMMDMVRGRTIARKNEGDHLTGHYVIRAIFLLSQLSPPDTAKELQSLVKYWVSQDTSRSIYEGLDTINNNNSVWFISRIKKLMEDPSVAPAPETYGFRMFAAMDRAVIHRPGYAFGISMHSGRIANYESINHENVKAWHTADGMTYLHNADLSQFSNDFWPTVDAYRLPGTTAVRESRIPPAKFNGSSWAGGVHLDHAYGAVGMELMPYGQTLQAKKSWFHFDDEIVALGSDISSAEGKSVETIVENRKLKPGEDTPLTVNGETKPSAAGWGETMDGVRWMHLAGNVKGADIGYFFPEPTQVNALRERRTGRWSDLHGSTPPENEQVLTASYMTLWIDHGTDPQDGAYAYVLLPNRSREQVAAYARQPDITVLENSGEAHAVRENKLNVIGVNFWKDERKTVEWVSCDRKASVMARESAGEIAVSVADPTQENADAIHLELNRSAKDIVAIDPRIEIRRLQPTIRLTVHVGGLKGMTVSAVFRTEETAAENGRRHDGN